jgi:hypothetical protein
MISADELRNTHGRTWEICTDLAIGVAAWRRVWVEYRGSQVNVLVAGGLDELAEKLRRQEA